MKERGKMVYFVVARLAAAVMLFWALDDHKYDYFTILRLVVCGVAAFAAYYAYSVVFEKQPNGWMYAFICIAILFNPLAPIHLSRRTWKIIDVAVGITFLISLFVLRISKKKIADKSAGKR